MIIGGRVDAADARRRVLRPLRGVVVTDGGVERSRSRLIWAVVGLIVIGLAGAVVLLLRSTDRAEPSATPTPAASPTTTPTPTPTLVAPLTGLPLKDPGLLDRPAIAVKVSDVRAAHPQVGVDQADIVFCEPIGVSYTRLAAVFHSTIPDKVGPVRSARPMDVPMLSPLTPAFAHTMAAEWVMVYLQTTAQLDSLGSLQVPSASGAYEVDPGRPAPDHVLAVPSVLLDLADTARPPEPYFAYAPAPGEASAVAGTDAPAITVPYGPDWDVRWDYDRRSGEYQRSQPWGPHVTADGTRISATNVLVLQVDSVTEKLAAGEGAPVPVLQLIDASGPLTAHANGRSVQGRWSKAGVNDPFVLTTRGGEPLLLVPGTTWVELPAEAPTTTPTSP